MKSRQLSNSRSRNDRTVASRRGLMLLQVVIVVTISAVLMSMAVTTLVGLMNAQRAAIKNTWQSTRFARLNRDFRDTIGSSTKVEFIPEKPQTIVCTQADNSKSEWTIGDQAIERKDLLPDKTIARHEVYSLPAETTAEWQELQQPARVRMVVNHGPATSSRSLTGLGKRHQTQIDAVINFSQRFEEGGKP